MEKLYFPQNQNAAASCTGGKTARIASRFPSALFTAGLHLLVFLIFFIAVKAPENLEVNYIEISLENFSSALSSDGLENDNSPAPATPAPSGAQTQASAPGFEAARQSPEDKPMLQQEQTATPNTILENRQVSEDLNASSGNAGHGGGRSQDSVQSSVSRVGVGQPSPLSGNPKPPYPELARKRGQQGLVLLNVEVDELGTPVSVNIKSSSGYSLLDDSAVATIRKWRFSPAQFNGKSASGRLVLPVEFRLEN